MMRWIVGSCLQLRLLVVTVAGVILFLGITQLRELPVDVLPEFSRPYVEIQSEALGLSAAEVEAMITTPMEADMLNGAPWVEEIRSESIPGLSSIKLYFKPGTNVLDARQLVQERLIQVYALPSFSKPPVMLQPVSSANRCLKIGLTSEELSLIDMSVLARWTIKPRLSGVPGVANVSIWGQRERQLQVQVDPQELHEKRVTLNQVISTAGNSLWVSPLTYLDASTPGTGGFIDTPNQRFGIRHISPISTPEQLAEVTVEGTKLRLGDVCKVVEDHQPLIGDAIIGEAPALTLVVEKFPWANTVSVTKGVEEALAALQPGLAGLQMDSTLFRPATFIETATANLGRSLLLGSVLLVLVLSAFLYNWRSAVISVVAIATSALTAGLVLYLLHATVNMMILAGLLIGLCVVIEDVIGDVHNIVRRLRQRPRESGREESFAWIVREATVEMRGVVLDGSLITLLAVAPVIFMEGFYGAFLQPLAFAYALAVVVSMLVAVSVTPALCVLLWRNAPLDENEPAFARQVRTAFNGAYARLLQRPVPALATVGVLMLAGVLILPWVRQESLLPTFRESDLRVDLDAKAGTSHPAMNRIASQLSRELLAIPGVKNVSADIGRAIMSDEVSDVNTCELCVSVDPSVNYDATLAAVKQAVSGYPGLERDVRTYLSQRLEDELKGDENGVVVRVYGDEFKVLRKKAKEVKGVLAKVAGVVDPTVDLPEEEPTVEIEPNLEACKQHGIKPGDVRRAASTLLSGILVGNLFEQQKVFDVVVWSKPEIRNSLTAVRDLRLDTPQGAQVRLEEVADVRIASAPTVINREAVARHIDVVAGVRGRDLAAIGVEVKRGLAQIDFPLEYRAELLGGPAERLAAQRRFLAFAAAAALGIFLLLQVALGSWRLAGLVVVLLPVALVGGLVAARATGGLISVGSLAGFLVLTGITARNALLLIRRWQQLAAESPAEPLDPEVAQFRAQYDERSPLNGDALPAPDELSPCLVLQGTRDRLVPIVATACATALAFAPLAFFGRLPGHEVVYPMALVILGGLVTTTLVSLHTLPSLYLWLGAKPAADIATEPMRLEEEIAEPEAVTAGVAQ